jgi:hypothetical protein
VREEVLKSKQQKRSIRGWLTNADAAKQGNERLGNLARRSLSRVLKGWRINQIKHAFEHDHEGDRMRTVISL